MTVRFLKSNLVRGFCRAILGFLPLSMSLPVAAAEGQGDAAVASTAASSDWQVRALEEIVAREYEVTWQAEVPLAGLRGAWQAPNRAHNLRTYFTESGIHVVPREEREASWEWGLELLRFGRPGQETAVRADQEPSAQEQSLLPRGRSAARRNRLDRDWGSISEWYVNDARGLEQGFTLFSPPPRAARAEGSAKRAPQKAGEVHIDMLLTGTLDPSFSTDGQAIDFRAPGGAIVLRYAGLKVVDARGRELTARMEGFAAPGVRGIRLAFDDTDAVYPVTVDPLATTPAWTAESNQASAEFGCSVATAGDVNGDGYSDVIVGARLYDNGQTDEGRAFVYHGSAFRPGGQFRLERGEQPGRRAFRRLGHDGGRRQRRRLLRRHRRRFELRQRSDRRRTGPRLSGFGLRSRHDPRLDRRERPGKRGVRRLGDDGGGRQRRRLLRRHRRCPALRQRPGRRRAGVRLSRLRVGPHHEPRLDGRERPGGRQFRPLGRYGRGRRRRRLLRRDRRRLHVRQRPGRRGTGLRLSRLRLRPGPDALLERRERSGEAPSSALSVATAGDVNGDGYSDIVVGANGYDNGQADEGRAYVYLGSASGLATAAAWTAERNQASATFGICGRDGG